MRFKRSLGFLLAWLFCFLMPASVFAVPFQVTSSLNSGPGSLREVIAAANTTTGVQTITFAISNSITVESELYISDAVTIEGSGVTIGARGPASWYVFNVSLSQASGTILRKLAVVSGAVGVYVSAADNVRILGCMIGTDWASAAGRGNQDGIILNQTHGTQVGGAQSGERNVISGNINGIRLIDDKGSKVQGNYIGTDRYGSSQRANSMGVYLQTGCINVMIGGNRLTGEGNVISYNGADGVYISNSSGNSICGNIIGLSANQSSPGPNAVGVDLYNSPNNQIGLPLSGYGNIISGNTNYGVVVTGTSTGVKVQNNLIGINDSSAVYGNNVGVHTNGGNIYLGGRQAAVFNERNVISGNLTAGIWLQTSGNTVCGNIIGLNLAGTSALSNTVGLRIMGDGNYIGGPNDATAIYGNIVSGNTDAGITVDSGKGNTLVGNWIGLDASGTIAIPNNMGLRFNGGGVNPNWIGFSGAYRNVIIGTTYALVTGNGYQNISGNYIGVNALGSQVTSGIGIQMNTVGRCMITNNIICSSGTETVSLNGSFMNRFYQNWINVLPNGQLGVCPPIAMKLVNSYSNYIGGFNQGNLIAGSPIGVRLDDAACIENGILANTICAFSTAGIDMAAGANRSKPAPVISLADSGWVAGTTVDVSGTTVTNHYVQLFKAENRPGGYGGSLQYLGQVLATSHGFWSIHLTDYYGGYLCALAYDPMMGDSSPFSLNVLSNWTAPTVTPTPSPTSTPSPIPQATATPTPTYNPGLAEVDLTGKLFLAFPNPAKGKVQFLLQQLDHAVDARIDIFNFQGERVGRVTGRLGAGRGQVLVWDCSGVTPGMYIAQITLDGKILGRGKIAVLAK
jgi:parallel beta-helix repeat protein